MVTQEEFEAMKKEFSSLPKEKQEKIVNNIKQQCVFCLISSEKIPSKKVYEDEEFLAVLDVYPASKGHVILFTKEHINFISDLPEKIFSIAKIIINSIKKLTPNVNLFIAEGQLAGQKSEHMVIHLIPRYEGDNIPLAWNPIKIEESELDEIQKQINSNISIPVKKEVIPEIKEPELESEEDVSKLMPENEEKTP